ncbi:Protein T19D7.7 [Aphelenchoides avenae]|nr:Protein T19D7.7 [Aphelenchus avenae]
MIWCFLSLAVPLALLCDAQNINFDKEAALLNNRIDAEFSDEELTDSEESNGDGNNIQTSYIDRSFNNRRTFTCPLVKSVFKTGTSGEDLSPEDIDIVAAMGDALSTGVGLWAGTDVEFRGAVFTVGGDANFDGLVTFSNILAEFNPKLEGISHGMGTPDSLPDHQYNVAETGAETDHMSKQAAVLLSRLHTHYTEEQLKTRWVLVFITVGTEELCAKCDQPNTDALRRAIITLRRNLPNVFVVLVGPVHVARSSHLTYNLLKPRCKCLSRLSNKELQRLQRYWKDALLGLEREFAERHYKTFALLTLPMLSIESRRPEQLFIPEKPLLNRKGHTYAAKWLWNRLITGPKYNASKIPLSEDTYYCPSLGCPFFRTPANLMQCTVMTKAEYYRLLATTPKTSAVTHNLRIEKMQHNIFWWILGIVSISTVSVFVFGTIFFCHGMYATKGRYENAPGV